MPYKARLARQRQNQQPALDECQLADHKPYQPTHEEFNLELAGFLQKQNNRFSANSKAA